MFFFALQSVGIKLLAARLDTLQIVFLRSALLALFMLPVALARGGIATNRPFTHITRTVVGLAGFLCIVYAIAHAPLADVTALTFTKPLFMVLLAIALFGEVVGWRRWVAIAIGFGGVLIMVRPGGAPLNLALIAALANGFLTALIAMMLKQLSRTERPDAMVFYFGFISAVMMAGPAWWVWLPPTAAEWGIMIVTALLGALGQSMSVRGYATGEASAMAPLFYIYLVYAGLFGFLFFGEIPTVWTLAGAAVIIASTLYIAIREARLKPRRPAAVPAPVPAE